MAKLVELSGCNGVGKSTIYKQLSKIWKDDDTWIPSHKLYPQKSIRFTSFNDFVVPLGNKILKKSTVDNTRLGMASEQFISLYPEFVDMFWELITLKQKRSFNGLDLRYESMCFFYNIIGKFQYIKNSIIEKSAIIDEGIIHQLGRITYKEISEAEIKNELSTLLDLMPLPDGLIYLATSARENANRLEHRSHITAIHKNLNTEALTEITKQSQLRRSIINIHLESKDIPILYLDSSQAIAKNVEKIVSFMNDF